MKQLFLVVIILFCFYDSVLAGQRFDFGHIGIVSVEGKLIYENRKMRLAETNNDLERYDDLIPVSIYQEGLGFRYCGYIDYTGNVLLQAKISYKGEDYFCTNAGPFVKGYSVVQFLNNNKFYFGIINSKGKFIMEPIYECLSIYNFANDFKILSYQSFDNVNNNVTIYDSCGKTIGYIKPRNYLLNYPFYESYAGVKSNNVEQNTRNYGFIDITGNVVIPFSFDIVFNFSNGYAVVSNEINNKLSYGYINSRGVIVIPLEYDNAYSFIDGVAKVKKGEHEFIINKDNKIIYEYQRIEDLNRFYVYKNQIIVYEKHNDKTYAGLLTTNGEWIIKPDKYHYITFFNDGYAIVCNETGKYIVNQDLEIICDITQINGIPNIDPVT